MLSCYIIDDEQYAIEALTTYIKKLPGLVLLEAFQSPLMALEAIRNRELPDIVFLDIDMTELSGLAVADLLPKSISIVFTTGHSKYALDGFKKDIADFLLKPYRFETFQLSVGVSPTENNY
ncbi:MAG: response regulator [Pedobacter sp.]|nr:MAG: response regulator [Pedobacter sp.]